MAMLSLTEGFGPESSGGSGAVFLVSVTMPDAFTVRLNLSSLISLTGASVDISNWSITPTTIYQISVRISDINVSSNKIDLTCSEQTNATIYTLNIPQGIVDSSSALPLVGPFDPTYTAYGVLPTIISATAIDSRKLQVIFSEPMDRVTATDPANYEIDPTLTVSAVERITDSVYLLTTSRQTQDQLYTVTPHNILDLQLESVDD